MHSRKICHSDLRLENFLVLEHCDLMEAQLKVIDFRNAREYEDDVLMLTKRGTPLYLAPEVLGGAGHAGHGYRQNVDCWSLGVILYTMVTGRPPFFADSDKEILQLARKGEFYIDEFPCEEMKALVKGLLRTNPKKRLSSEEALHHPWVQKIHDPSLNYAQTHMREGVLNSMRAFQSFGRLKQGILGLVALHQSG